MGSTALAHSFLSIVLIAGSSVACCPLPSKLADTENRNTSTSSVEGEPMKLRLFYCLVCNAVIEVRVESQ